MSDLDDKEPALLSEISSKYKLTPQQEKAVQNYLFDPVCKGDETASYGKAGYDKNRPDALKVSNAKNFFRKKRIINRVSELLHDKSILSLDVFNIDKATSTKDLKDALAIYKARVSSKDDKASDTQAYIRLIDMQNKIAGLYKDTEEVINTESDRKVDKAQEFFLKRAKEQKDIEEAKLKAE